MYESTVAKEPLYVTSYRMAAPRQQCPLLGYKQDPHPHLGFVVALLGHSWPQLVELKFTGIRGQLELEGCAQSLLYM